MTEANNTSHAQWLEAARDSNIHGYIFCGPNGSGKFAAAVQLAANRTSGFGDNADINDIIRRARDGGLPNLILIEPQDKPSIGIAQIQDLVSSLSLNATRASGGRAIVISPADQLTLPAQNALLKLIEEPPLNTLIVLITESLNNLSLTIQSRVATMFFSPHKALIADLSDIEVSGLLSVKIFTRIIAAKTISDTKPNFTSLATLLQRQLLGELQDGDDNARDYAKCLNALETARKRLDAGVSLRACLDGFAMEIN